VKNSKRKVLLDHGTARLTACREAAYHKDQTPTTRNKYNLRDYTLTILNEGEILDQAGPHTVQLSVQGTKSVCGMSIIKNNAKQWYFESEIDQGDSTMTQWNALTDQRRQHRNANGCGHTRVRRRVWGKEWTLKTQNSILTQNGI